MRTATTQDLMCRLGDALADGPEAFRRALGALFADEVDLRHEPPLPPDGIVDGKALVESFESRGR